MNVLELVGIADQVVAESLPLGQFVEKTAAGEVLAESDLPSSFAAKYGQPCVGIKRTTMSLMLKKTLRDAGIELREGWRLSGLEETERDVTAVFENGESVTGSFLVGCDGLRSAVRGIMLAKRGVSQPLPDYTGIAQTSGISRTPQSLGATPALVNWYGRGLHFVSYPISESHTSWGATRRQEQAEEESWRLYSPQEVRAQTARLAAVLDGWDPVVRELVLTAERIVKYGLFDREEMRPSEWYSRRCVLIGDAAHPTSPHLGQGANQALEDSYNLCQSLPSLDPRGGDVEQWLSSLGVSLSERYFRPLAEKRQPRTSSLVRAARAIGELRVAEDPRACEERDAAIVSGWRDAEALETRYRGLFTATFPAVDQ